VPAYLPAAAAASAALLLLTPSQEPFDADARMMAVTLDGSRSTTMSRVSASDPRKAAAAASWVPRPSSLRLGADTGPGAGAGVLVPGLSSAHCCALSSTVAHCCAALTSVLPQSESTAASSGSINLGGYSSSSSSSSPIT
jgi:hypothetical protein